MTMADIKELIGKTLTEVLVSDDKEIISIKTSDGDAYQMYHSQDCCESVSVEDVCGDLNDIIGSPIVNAEASTNSQDSPDGFSGIYDDSFTWTFYKIDTSKGGVTIRWLGQSNGYYSESVDFVKV